MRHLFSFSRKPIELCFGNGYNNTIESIVLPIVKRGVHYEK